MGGCDSSFLSRLRIKFMTLLQNVRISGAVKVAAGFSAYSTNEYHGFHGTFMPVSISHVPGSVALPLGLHSGVQGI